MRVDVPQCGHAGCATTECHNERGFPVPVREGEKPGSVVPYRLHAADKVTRLQQHAVNKVLRFRQNLLDSTEKEFKCSLRNFLKTAFCSGYGDEGTPIAVLSFDLCDQTVRFSPSLCATILRQRPGSPGHHTVPPADYGERDGCKP